VRADVLDGIVTAEEARDVYGVDVDAPLLPPPPGGPS
jgi:hypothetical protein